MTKLPVVSGKKVVKAFSKLGFELDHQTGSASTRKIIQRFCQMMKENNIHYSNLILFGSQANGEVDPKSDIDLCVIFKKIEDKEIDLKLMRIASQNLWNMDILVTTEKELKHNMVSPILHEIRTRGVFISS